VYTGSVLHKGQTYTGEHAAILAPGVWERVQERLVRDKIFPRGCLRNKHMALLNGLLHCECCSMPMVYSYAVKNERKYPYYVCRRAQREGWASCPSKSLPAQAIEESVLRRIRETNGGVLEEWDGIERIHQIALLHGIVERVGYNGAARQISIRFRQSGIAVEQEARA
jgi:Recombinase zinc beta ribbon domain